MSTCTPPIRILIVDDHPTMLWGLERLVASQAQMQVVGTAGSVDDALAQGQAHSPALVLLDVNLGERSGLDAIAPLTAGGAKVLVLTGERKKDLLDRAVQLGARGVLSKDAEADTVLKAVRKVHDGELWLDRLTLGRVLDGLRDMQESGARACPEKQKQASLTLREHKIIQAIVEGRGASNKTLAAGLFISEHTLRNHLSSIYHKLGVGNRLELYAYALQHQLGTQAPALDGLTA